MELDCGDPGRFDDSDVSLQLNDLSDDADGAVCEVLEERNVNSWCSVHGRVFEVECSGVELGRRDATGIK